MFNNLLLKGIDVNVPYKLVKYDKNTIIFNEGERMNYVGIIESGLVTIKSSTIDGYEFEILSIGPSNIFGDMLAFSNNNVLPGYIETMEETEIILIKKDDFKVLLESNKEFLNNYLKHIAKINIDKTYKIKLLGQPSIREKIFFYLKEEIRKTGSNKVMLNMTKEELASIMSLNRPSLSRELMRMKKEGLIDYDKNSITYLE